jgi:RNA polymerase sigma factor for flagellar operon FliA
MSERHELILNFMPLANKLAWEKKRELPRSVDIDELKSAAYMGLVKAANRFDPKCNVPFPAYARWRIRGEILDYLRELRWDKSAKVQNADQEVLEILYSTHDVSYTEEFFGKVTKSLSAIGQKVVILYYVQERTLKEIGTLLGLSESRISQILSQSRSEIKRRFSESDLRYEIAA